ERVDDERFAPAVRGQGHAGQPLDLGVDFAPGDDDGGPVDVLVGRLVSGAVDEPASQVLKVLSEVVHAALLARGRDRTPSTGLLARVGASRGFTFFGWGMARPTPRSRARRTSSAPSARSEMPIPIALNSERSSESERRRPEAMSVDSGTTASQPREAYRVMNS